METRQLSYFMLACQHKNHTESAASFGLSPSALSANISLLERELGLTLFQRGPRGHFPTETARWLYQLAEPILQLTEAAETILDLPAMEPIRHIDVTSPLRFMLGRLSRSASLAARQLRQSHPGVVARVKFTDSASRRDTPQPAASDGHREPDGCVVLDYAEDGGNGLPLLIDEWVCVTPFDPSGKADAVTPLDAIRKRLLLVPSMAPELIEMACVYCRANGLPDPKVIDEDVGTFPTLSRATEPFCLLAPQSLVAGGIERLNLGQTRLPTPLSSQIVARIAKDAPGAEKYVSLLKTSLLGPDPNVIYRPRISQKQMRYFVALCEHLNMTNAARTLHVVQPALSKQLRNLESIVGHTLFIRRRTGLQPTAQSKRLIELLAPAARQFDDIAFQAAHQSVTSRQRMSIGFIPMINHNSPLVLAMTTALDEWSRDNPGVELQVREAPTQTLHQWVDSGAISFAVVEAQVSRTSQLDLKTRDMFGLVSNASAPLWSQGPILLRELTQVPLVLPGDTFGLRQILDHAAADEDIRLAPRMEVDSLTMILALIRRTALATILPKPSVQPYLDDGVFQFNPITEPSISRRLSILFSTERTLTEIERDLIAIFRKNLALAGFGPVAGDAGRRARELTDLVSAG